MVLSTPSAGLTPSDASSSEALQSDTTAFDATLLLQDSFLSAATDRDSGHPPTTTTSMERSHVVRLLEEPPTDKSLDVLDFAFDSSLAVLTSVNFLVSLRVKLPLVIDPAI